MIAQPKFSVILAATLGLTFGLCLIPNSARGDSAEFALRQVGPAAQTRTPGQSSAALSRAMIHVLKKEKNELQAQLDDLNDIESEHLVSQDELNRIKKEIAGYEAAIARNVAQIAQDSHFSPAQAREHKNCDIQLARAVLPVLEKEKSELQARFNDLNDIESEHLVSQDELNRMKKNIDEYSQAIASHQAEIAYHALKGPSRIRSETDRWISEAVQKSIAQSQLPPLSGASSRSVPTARFANIATK